MHILLVEKPAPNELFCGCWFVGLVWTETPHLRSYRIPGAKHCTTPKTKVSQGGLTFGGDPKLGDASVVLTDAEVSDTGTYQCKVKKAPGVDMRKLTLVVMGKDEYTFDTPPTPPQVSVLPVLTPSLLFYVYQSFVIHKEC